MTKPLYDSVLGEALNAYLTQVIAKASGMDYDPLAHAKASAKLDGVLGEYSRASAMLDYLADWASDGELTICIGEDGDDGDESTLIRRRTRYAQGECDDQTLQEAIVERMARDV